MSAIPVGVGALPGGEEAIWELLGLVVLLQVLHPCDISDGGSLLLFVLQAISYHLQQLD